MNNKHRRARQGRLKKNPAQRQKIHFRGAVKLELFGPDGQLKECVEKHNLVVDAGLDFIKSLLLDSVTPTTFATMTDIAIGTGAVAAAPGDVALGAEVARQVFTVGTGYTAGGTGVATVDTTFAAGVGTGAITEAGVFDAPAAGNMLNRVVFTAINKGAGDTLKVSFTFTFS